MLGNTLTDGRKVKTVISLRAKTPLSQPLPTCPWKALSVTVKWGNMKHFITCPSHESIQSLALKILLQPPLFIFC